MKKNLLIISMLAAIPALSQAAQVNLYGIVDMGLVYKSDTTDLTHNGEIKDKKGHSFALQSGNSAKSRLGIKGSEDLGNGLEVGFLLENGFDADSGMLIGAKESRLFDRESSAYVKTSFGTFRAGRISTMLSGVGSMGFYAKAANPFGNGWATVIGSHSRVFANQIGIMDNVLGYVSPTVGGLTVYAQYGMGEQTAENTSKANRYAAVGAQYVAGPLELVAAVDHTNKKSAGLTKDENPHHDKVKDAYTLNLAGSYNFGAVKAYVATQYFKNAVDVAGMTTTNKLNHRPVNQADGWGLTVGTKSPLMGGQLLVSAGYMDGKIYIDNDHRDIYAYDFGVGYTYNISKRTSLYAGTGYRYRDGKSKQVDFENKTVEVTSGLVHKF